MISISYPRYNYKGSNTIPDLHIIIQGRKEGKEGARSLGEISSGAGVGAAVPGRQAVLTGWLAGGPSTAGWCWLLTLHSPQDGYGLTD